MENRLGNPRDERNDRLRTGGWGALLAWTGAVLLAPGHAGTLWLVWLAGVGVVVLGAAAVGAGLGLKPTAGTLVLGAVALVSGAGGLAGVPVPTVGFLLIGWGLAITLAALRQHRTAGR